MTVRILMSSIAVVLLTLSALVSPAPADDSVLMPRLSPASDRADHLISPPRMSVAQYECTLPPLQLRSPESAHSESSPWRKAPAILVGTGVLCTYDKDIHRWMQSNRSPSTERLAAFGETFGDPKTYALPAAALYLYGSLARDERARDTASMAVQSIVVSGVVVQALKHTVHRHRPSGTVAEGEPDDKADFSFPSGHTAVAFAAATAVSAQYGDNDAVPLIAYSLATLTGWARLNDGVHWSSDVLFGSYVGYLAAKGVLDSDDEHYRSTSITAYPQALPISLSFEF